MSKYSCTMEQLNAGMDREAQALEYAELRRKWAWLRMRSTDTVTPNDDYEQWYRDYRETDRLDPLPRCQPGTCLWREMNRLASRDGWPMDGSDFRRSLHP